MASPLLHLVFSTLTMGVLLSIAAEARHCNSFFISYSFSVVRPNSFPNPNPDPIPDSFSHFLPLAKLDVLKPPSLLIDRVQFFPGVQLGVRRPQFMVRPSSSFLPSSNSVGSSLRARTKDIISVVLALLFGVGCGFLTAATMYLAWSLFSSRIYLGRGSYGLEDEDSFEEDDESLRKDGYVKIPDAKPSKIAV